jgi:hypothetical protein
VAHFRGVDPLPARVLNQILLGVSTRGYHNSLQAVPAEIVARREQERGEPPPDRAHEREAWRAA